MSGLRFSLEFHALIASVCPYTWEKVIQRWLLNPGFFFKICGGKTFPEDWGLPWILVRMMRFSCVSLQNPDLDGLHVRREHQVTIAQGWRGSFWRLGIATELLGLRVGSASSYESFLVPRRQPGLLWGLQRLLLTSRVELRSSVAVDRGGPRDILSSSEKGCSKTSASRISLLSSRWWW